MSSGHSTKRNIAVVSSLTSFTGIKNPFSPSITVSLQPGASVVIIVCPWPSLQVLYEEFPHDKRAEHTRLNQKLRGGHLSDAQETGTVPSAIQASNSSGEILSGFSSIHPTILNTTPSCLALTARAAATNSRTPLSPRSRAIKRKLTDPGSGTTPKFGSPVAVQPCHWPPQQKVCFQRRWVSWGGNRRLLNAAFVQQKLDQGVANLVRASVR